MHHPRLITALLTLAVVLGLAATYAPEGMVRFYGTDNLTNLVTGAAYMQTDSNTFWVGGVSSNPVKVGTAGVASTNDINTAVAPLATTNYVNNAVSGLTTNLGFLDLSTNACTLIFTNGLLKGVTTP